MQRKFTEGKLLYRRLIFREIFLHLPEIGMKATVIPQTFLGYGSYFENDAPFIVIAIIDKANQITVIFRRIVGLITVQQGIHRNAEHVGNQDQGGKTCLFRSGFDQWASSK